MGVLNGRLGARRLWSSDDERRRITLKELNKAARLVVERFLPQLAGRNVLLHLRDNNAVCHVLAGLTSRSAEMMAELRRLWCLVVGNA